LQVVLVLGEQDTNLGLEAPPGFEPGMEVLQTSALPLGYGAGLSEDEDRFRPRSGAAATAPDSIGRTHRREENGAGNGIRTRDFDLGKVALYH
jgi:hypothetical protein